MKIVIFLLLFCFIPSAKLYAQQTEEEAIDTLLKTTQKFRKEFQKLSLNKGSINKCPYEEVLEGARALYKFNRAYPKSTKLGVLISTFINNKNITALLRQNKYNELADSAEKYPGADILALQRQIPKYFNKYEETFINKIDGVISGEVLSYYTISNEFYPDPVELKIIEVKIDEVVDGMNEFKQGEIIKIWIAPMWGGDGYENGKKYLFHLRYRESNNYNGKVITPPMSIYVNCGKGPAFFPINDEILIDPTNSFGFGYKVEFKSIKNYIIDLRNKLLLTE